MKDELPTDVRDLNSEQSKQERCSVILMIDEIGRGSDFPFLLDLLAHL